MNYTYITVLVYDLSGMAIASVSISHLPEGVFDLSGPIVRHV